MAHFARLNDVNVVQEVVVIANAVINDAAGLENEQMGIDFCHTLWDPSFIWKQTSYNGNFRGRFAGIGFTYDPALDIFIDPSVRS